MVKLNYLKISHNTVRLVGQSKNNEEIEFSARKFMKDYYETDTELKALMLASIM
jgi:hypothetical protein